MWEQLQASEGHPGHNEGVATQVIFKLIAFDPAAA